MKVMTGPDGIFFEMVSKGNNEFQKMTIVK